MKKKLLGNRAVRWAVLCLNVVPILLLPPSSFSPSTQEWWLPVLLCFLAVVALVQLLIRRSEATWPWRLISFAQGMNVISRLMMLMPHITVVIDGIHRFDGLYVALAAVSILFSVLEIGYCELPEVRRPLQA
jgi:hypothetical protein